MLRRRGDTKLLQNEIVRLNTEISNLKSGLTEPAIQENTELRVKLDKWVQASKQPQLHACLLSTSSVLRLHLAGLLDSNRLVIPPQIHVG